MFNIYWALIPYSHWAKYSTEMLSMTQILSVGQEL